MYEIQLALGNWNQTHSLVHIARAWYIPIWLYLGSGGGPNFSPNDANFKNVL